MDEGAIEIFKQDTSIMFSTKFCPPCHLCNATFAGVVFLFLVTVIPGSATAAYPVHGLITGGNAAQVAASESSKEVEVPDKKQTKAESGSYTISDLQIMLEGLINVLYWRFDILITANSAKVSYDMAQAMDRISFGNGTRGFLRMLGMLGLVFSLALGVEFLLRRFVLLRFRLEIPDDEDLPVSQRLWILLLEAIPKLVLLTIFGFASYFFYVLLYTDYFSGICPLYLSLLTAILVARTLSIFSVALFSPTFSSLRLLPLDTEISRIGHRSVVLFSWLVSGGILCIALFEHAGVDGDSKLILRMAFGSFCLFAVAMLLFFYRTIITQWIRGSDFSKRAHWFRDQMASKWVFMALGYIFLLWAVWVVQLVLVGPEFGFAYGVSLFVVPIFLILDSLLGWLLSTINEPGSAQVQEPDDSLPEPPEAHVAFFYFRTFTRVFLVVGIGLWIMSLWGKGILFSEATKAKGTEVVFILLVAYILWQGLNRSISSYLDNRAREQAETAEDVDSEWGDSPLLDRSQTLLPLVRKFSGVIVAVMMVLLILSVLGVNIGPLLAGAGVVGIAIGFGAQKLVNDVLSGFFFLLDDAFRVGEYIKTASISGAVERITLRNVMLRHHRGMLQIVPYSDLGAITNFMRGGIVVKFNLQFPYDTDVDQVRKVIKKVGIAMLNDPEFGKNFIKQLKSQGIREVADSVLTIRVKFTAHPGTHFLIRREAYRRLTEALAEKGIFYAHRKVIVEVPSDASGAAQEMDDATRQKLAEAGAAAQIATQPAKSQKEG